MTPCMYDCAQAFSNWRQSCIISYESARSSVVTSSYVASLSAEKPNCCSRISLFSSQGVRMGGRIGLPSSGTTTRSVGASSVLTSTFVLGLLFSGACSAAAVAATAQTRHIAAARLVLAAAAYHSVDARAAMLNVVVDGSEGALAYATMPSALWCVVRVLLLPGCTD